MALVETEEEVKKIGENTQIKAPDITDLVNFAKFECSFELNGRATLHTISVSLLWEGEIKKIIIDSARVTDPRDDRGRDAWMKVEELVAQIDLLDGKSYSDKSNPSHHKALKDELRVYLETFDPTLITLIRGRIELLRIRRNSWVEDNDKELKKKFMEKVMETHPL